MLGGAKRHGRGYARASALIVPSNGIGTTGRAEAQIGAPLRRGAWLTVKLREGGTVLGRTVGVGGTIRLIENAGTCIHA
jgi:hypothetical protein